MPKQGNYCKAYPIERFREFGSWSENLETLRKETQEVGGKSVETQRSLKEGDYFFLQEDFTVTDGIFMDEGVIFDNVTPEWIAFCKEILEFEAPQYQLKNRPDSAP
jgi:hypothetical protein